MKFDFNLIYKTRFMLTGYSPKLNSQDPPYNPSDISTTLGTRIYKKMGLPTAS
jgi:hypothetical protein